MPPGKTLLRLLAALACLAALAPPAKAVIVWTGDVDPADPTAWTYSNTNGYVGYHADGTVAVSDGSVLLSEYAYLGNESTATGEVTVSGAGSRWDNRFSLYVGREGAGVLTVVAGGTVTNRNGYLGQYAGSTGAATVSGPGSMWSNSGDLYVGRQGSGSLTVNDGGFVSARTLWASLSDLHGDGAITATHGAVLDADLVFDAASGTQQTLAFGSGGTLTVAAKGGALGVGYKGAGSITLTDGVSVFSDGYLGFHPGSSGVAIVSGVGSQWGDSLFPVIFQVGGQGNGTLIVEAGGTVVSSRAYIGSNSGSNGAVTVSGNGSRFTSTYSLHVGRGTLTVEAGAQLTSTDGYLAYDTGSTATATVTGTGSWWNNETKLYVGHEGAGALFVEGGGAVTNSDGYLGYAAGSAGAATVTGLGSVWSSSGQLYVGLNGSGSLTVEDGGYVSAGSLWASLGDLHGNGAIEATRGAVIDADLRFDASGGAQFVTSFGAGGTLTVTADGGHLGAGYRGAGSLAVAEGAEIVSSGGHLGYFAGASGIASVSGAGSLWSTSSNLYVGREGSGRLTVDSGGVVTSKGAYLGYVQGSAGDALITGSGSEWKSGTLYVGYAGVGTLTIEEAGKVTSNSAYLSFAYEFPPPRALTADGVDEAGDAAVTPTSTATITGAGTQWVIASSLIVGGDSNAMLNVASGGQVTNVFGYLGYSAGSTGFATITGPGSVWSNTGELYVGRQGSGSLTVEDGGFVSAGSLWASLEDLHGNGEIVATQGAVLDADLRFGASGGAQFVTEFGEGGTLTVTAAGGRLGAGYRGNGTLSVASGVAVDSFSGFLGYYAGSTGAATVTGTGSQWNSSGSLFVGREGAGSLTVEGGGTVTNSLGYLGYSTGSTGAATVTGTASQWNNSSSVYVGRAGAGSLTVAAGGTVTNVDGYLGYSTGSTGAATVTGTGSRWTNEFNLYVGRYGDGALCITEGGLVSARTWRVGYGDNSDSYINMSTGGMLALYGDATATPTTRSPTSTT